MERKLQYIFISILVVLLIFSVITNLIFDRKARNIIIGKTNKIMEYAPNPERLSGFVNTPFRKELISKYFKQITQKTSKNIFLKDIVNYITNINFGNVEKISIFKMNNRFSAIVDVLLSNSDKFGVFFWNAEKLDETSRWIPLLILNKNAEYNDKISLLNRVMKLEEKRHELLKKQRENKKKKNEQ